MATTTPPKKSKAQREQELKDENRMIKESDRALKSKMGKYEIPTKPMDDAQQYMQRLKQEENQEKRFERENVGQLYSKFDSYTAQISKLKMNILGHAIIQIAPVIPITPQAYNFTTEKMQSVGLLAFYDAGYCIFEDQILLGINFKDIAKGHVGVDEDRVKSQDYVKRIETLNNKLGPISKIGHEIRETKGEITHINPKGIPLLGETKRLVEWEKQLFTLEQEQSELEQSIAPESKPKKSVEKTSRVRLSQIETEKKEVSDGILKEMRVLDSALNDSGTREITDAAVRARALRLAKLDEKLLKLEHELEELKVTHKAEYIEHNNLVVEYREHQDKNKHLGGTAFSGELFTYTLQCLDQINSKLDLDDKLIFPGMAKASFNMKMMEKAKTPTFIKHGDIAYYWVMKSHVWHKWCELMGHAEIIITGWTFPQDKKQLIMQAVVKEANTSSSFVNAVIKFKRLGLSKDTVYKKMVVHLIKEQKEMDDFFTETFERVWENSDEIIESEKTAFNPPLHPPPKLSDPKVASDLLRRKK